MISTHSSQGLIWLDLVAPTEQEIGDIVKRYGLHPLVGEELRSYSADAKAKIQFYKDYALVILTLPVRVRSGKGYEIVSREVDFVIGRDFIITARNEAIEQLEYFAKIFEANTILDKDKHIDHHGHLFYYIVRRIYAGMFADLENIRDALVAAESHVFKGEERRMVEVLSELSRELIDFRQAARIHRDVWEALLASAHKDIFGQDFAQFAADLRDQFNRIHEVIGNARELLADLRETNDSLLDTKQNDIMRTLTIISFVFFPATFIAALFTIPAKAVPLIEDHSGWNIILAGIIAVTLGIWAFVRYKRWL